MLGSLGVLGRIYIANEGINAQISVPTENFEQLRDYIYSHDFLNGIRLNIAVEESGKSFWMLKIKVREKVVADGIDDPSFSMERKGKYVNAAEFNALTEKEGTLIVDMRNYYEYEIGHFRNAIDVPSDTFREQLHMATEQLADRKDDTIIMYCTGGIRCEKASAWLLHKGFKNVYHLEGGVIEYARKAKQLGLENKFIGKNFVFDNRMSESISHEIISHCHQCGEDCDTHTNCDNLACHLLFIQCSKCREKYEGCCSEECKMIHNLSEDEQRELRKGKRVGAQHFNNSKKRVRPRLILKQELSNAEI